MKNPGSAGLTVDRFGDSDKWVPSGVQQHGSDTALPDKQASSSLLLNHELPNDPTT
jgi:hypothetical protein